jgi:predicted  nucleic acid-binding Zn-ribbon protein
VCKKTIECVGVLLKHNATFAPNDFPLKQDELLWYNEQKRRTERVINTTLTPVDQPEPASASTQQSGNSQMLQHELQQAEMQLSGCKNELAIIRQESHQYQTQLEQSRSLAAQQQTQLTQKDQQLQEAKQQLAQRDQTIRDLQSRLVNESLPNPTRNKESKCFSLF